MHKLLLLTLSTLTSFITFSNISHASTHLGSATELVGKLQGSYSVNQGAFNYSIPIDVPAGINGHIPSLSINYNSQSGNGLLGMGFSLSGLSSIHRCAKTIAIDGVKGGINIDENDRLCLDGQRLIAVSGDYWSEGSQYRTEINTYARITYTNNSFKVETKDGNTLYYGTSTDSNIEYQGKTDTKVWALTTKEDSSGNQITYTYYKNNDTGEFNIKNITYADNTIEFSYQDKTVPFTGYQAGSKITSSKILRSITLKTHNVTQGTTQSTYHLTYELADTTPKKELLKAVQKCVENKCLEAIKFEWNKNIDISFNMNAIDTNLCANGSRKYGVCNDSDNHSYINYVDINGDGLTDICVRADQGVKCHVNTGNSEFDMNAIDTNLCANGSRKYGVCNDSDNHSYINYVDINGDGLTDICVRADQGVKCHVNTGNSEFDMNAIDTNLCANGSRKYGVCNDSDNHSYINYVDINGDGLTDICVRADQGVKCHVNTGNSEFDMNAIDTNLCANGSRKYGVCNDSDNHSYINYVDINGDGLTDICVRADQGVKCHVNTGNSEFDMNAIDTNLCANGSRKYGVCNDSDNHSYINYVDINGDGLTDICVRADQGVKCHVNTGNSEFDMNAIDTNLCANGSRKYGVCNDSDNHSYINYVDINGDGLTDICVRADQGVKCHVNTGNSEFDMNAIDTNLCANGSRKYGVCNDSDNHSYINYVDINGDGLTDICVRADQGVKCHVNKTQKITLKNINSGFDLIITPYYANLNTSEIYTKTKSSAYPNIILGGGPMQVVSGVETSTPTQAKNKTTYRYKNFGINVKGRGSLGFEEVIETNELSNTRVHTKYSQEYPYIGSPLETKSYVNDVLVSESTTNYQHISSYHDSVINNENYACSLNDNKYSSKNTCSNSCKISNVEWVNVFKNSKTTTVLPKSSSNESWVCDGYFCSIFKNGTVTWFFDTGIHRGYRYGAGGVGSFASHRSGQNRQINPNQKIYHIYHSGTTPAYNQSYEQINYTYGTCLSTPFVYNTYISSSTTKEYDFDNTYGESTGELLKTTTLKNSAPDEFGNILSITNTIEDNEDNIWTTQTTNEYDNDTTNWHLARLRSAEVTHSSPNPNVPDITKTSAFTYNADGLLETEVIEPQSDTALTTSYTYDSYGNMTSKTVDAFDIEPRTTSYTYSDDGKHNTTTTNALGHSESKIYDALGRVKSLTGPNGLTTHWEYDALNRKTKETRADGTTTQWRYEYDDSVTFPNGNKSVYKVTVTKNKVSNATYFDALDNKLRTTSIGFDGSTIIEDAYYNQLGQITKQSLPYYEGDTAHFVLSTYDDLGRVTSITKKNDTGEDITSTTSYNGYQTTTIDFNGNSKTTTKNAKDKVIWVDEPLGAYLTHTHDSMGNLIETNANGVVTIINYDNRGNKISMNDPSMGVWSYTYDSLGQLKSQTDAKGQIVTMEYDKLGRMKERQEPEGHTTWIYDTQEKGIGKLARVSSPNLLKTYTYDALGRAHETTTHLNGEEYTVTLGYDEHSRVTTKTHPGGFITENVYNEFGYLFAVRSPKEQVTDYDWEHLQGLLDQYLENANQAIRKANHLEKLAKEYFNITMFVHHGLNFSSQGKSAWIDQYANRFLQKADKLKNIAQSVQESADAYRQKADNFLQAATNFNHLINNHYYQKVIARGGALHNNSSAYYYHGNSAPSQSTKPPMYNAYRGYTGLYGGSDSYGRQDSKNNNYYYNANNNIIISENIDYRDNDNTAGGTAGSYSSGWTYCSSKQSCQYWHDHSQRIGEMILEWSQDYDTTLQENLEYAQVQADIGIQVLGIKNQSPEYLRWWVKEQSETYTSYRQRAAKLRTLAQDNANFTSDNQLKADNESHYEDMFADTGNVYFWRAKSRDAANRLTGHLVGNGLSTENTYNPATGNLLTIESGFSDNNKIRDLAFVYDDNQNVLQRNNNALGVQMNYEYDVLDRLKVTYQSTANTSPLSAQMQDDATLSVYTYDINGNIKTKGAKTLHYEDNSYQVSHATEGNVRTHYDYDENGNMTTVTSELLSAENLKEEEVTIIDYTIHTVYGDGFEFLFNITQMQALIGRELNRREDFIVTNKRSGKTGFARFYSRKRHHNQPEGTGTASWTGRYNTSYEWQVGDQLTIEMRPKKAINPALVFDIQSANYGGRFKFNLAKVESILGRKLMPNEEFKVTNMSTNRTGIAIFSNEDDPVYGQSSDLLGSGSWKTNSYYGDWSGNDKVMLDISHANQNIPRDKQIRYTSFNKPKSFSGSVATTEFSLPVTSADYSRTLNFKLSDLERITNTELKDGDEFELLGTGSANRHKAALKVRIQLTPNLTHASYQVKNNPSAYGQMYFVKGRHSGNWTHGTVDVKWLTTTQQTTQFLYDENRSRYAKIQNTYEGTAHTQIRTTYIGKSYEKITEGDKITHKYFIYNADGKLIATHSKEEDSNPFTQEEPTVDKTNYLHYDNLGSIDTITDGQGNIVQQSEYKPFGEQYRIDNNISQPLLTNRGYTGHEHINEFGFIHMNGRVYDPSIGRFLSADPHIQAPLNTQSYNRYSYVLNNPLKYTDPSGYFLKKIFRGIKKGLKKIVKYGTSFMGLVFEIKAVKNFFIKHKWAQQLGMLISNAVGGPLFGANFSAYLTRIHGGSTTDVFKSFAISYASAKVANFIGHGGTNGAPYFGEGIQTSLAHGVSQGAMTAAQGGRFKDGFIGGFISHEITGIKSTNSKVLDGIINITLSGTASKLAGGSFANGARSATFVYLYNHLGRGYTEDNPMFRGDNPELHKAYSQMEENAPFALTTLATLPMGSGAIATQTGRSLFGSLVISVSPALGKFGDNIINIFYSYYESRSVQQEVRDYGNAELKRKRQSRIRWK